MDAVLHRSKQLLKILYSPFSMLYQREARSELSILNYQL